MSQEKPILDYARQRHRSFFRPGAIAVLLCIIQYPWELFAAAIAWVSIWGDNQAPLFPLILYSVAAALPGISAAILGTLATRRPATPNERAFGIVGATGGAIWAVYVIYTFIAGYS